MSFHIVADSCCELTADMKKRGNIEIAPLTLEVGGESILDDETFDQKSFPKEKWRSARNAQNPHARLRSISARHF